MNPKRAGTPSVSVALATCNGARYLREQLADLAAQTHLPAELVVCDDASGDETMAILSEFAATAPFPVRVSRNPVRLGYKANFMRCTGLCTGELIAFCDQDDRWHPDKLKVLAPLFADGEVLLAFHDAAVVDDTGASPGTLYPNWREPRRWPALTAFPWMFSPGLTQVFRRSLCRFNDLWEQSEDQNARGEKLPHDRWFFFLASVLGEIAYSPAPLVDYRQHAGNTYGWLGIAPGLRNRIAKEAGQAAQAVHRRASAAANRARILERLAERTGGEASASALRGAEAYRQFAERYRHRASMHAGNSLGERGRAFARLLQSGAYGRGIWRFGLPALLLDLAVGMPGTNRARPVA